MINMNQNGVPIFSSISTDRYTGVSKSVYIEALPLISSIHYENNDRNSETNYLTLELSEVKDNFVTIFDSMEYAIHLNKFNFSYEFANMVTSGFLELLFRPIIAKDLSLGVSVRDIITMYRVCDFMDNRNFDLISKEFLDSVNHGLMSSSALQDIAIIFKNKILDNYNSNDFKTVLYPEDWGNFSRNVRRSIAQDHGIHFTSL